MPEESKLSTNWFESGNADYAQFRPEYPPLLSKFLADACRLNDKAVDVGCGNGQLTEGLAPYFKTTIGVDPSAGQISNAKSKSNVTYVTAPAESLPIDLCKGANLVTVAQAAHWFNLPLFYNEVQKIAAPDAVLALISYGIMVLDSELNPRFQKFYDDEIGPFWPPERKLVDNGYRDILFPFKEIAAPKMSIEVEWDLAQFLGYVSTWSAVTAMKKQKQDSILQTFGDDFKKLWSNPSEKRKMSWPISMRLARLP